MTSRWSGTIHPNPFDHKLEAQSLVAVYWARGRIQTSMDLLVTESGVMIIAGDPTLVRISLHEGGRL